MPDGTTIMDLRCWGIQQHEVKHNDYNMMQCRMGLQSWIYTAEVFNSTKPCLKSCKIMQYMMKMQLQTSSAGQFNSSKPSKINTVWSMIGAQSLIFTADQLKHSVAWRHAEQYDATHIGLKPAKHSVSSTYYIFEIETLDYHNIWPVRRNFFFPELWPLHLIGC